MIDNVTNRVIFVQRDNHIILFLYINIERGVLVVFPALAAFFGIFAGLISVSFLEDSLPVPGFGGKKLNMLQSFLIFFFGSVFCYLSFENIHFRFRLRCLTSGFLFKRQNFEFVAVDIGVLIGFFFDSFLL